ncbi:MAG TPA: hypothetical protein ENJ46_06505 [Hellea balneolensis]|uniref:Uncharacterized protein n=1 Tax=Hellea balneolensis TaxID=287478 RepID=A0A7C3CCJ1_9PROT|nr:hypothetical protein [Hellea balneolensis]
MINTLAFLVGSSLVICAVVALYVHLAGFSNRAVLSDDQAVHDKVHHYYPKADVVRVERSADNHTALALFKTGDGCLLQAMGHRWIAQPLKTGLVHKIKTSKNGGLHVVFHDYTTPSIGIAVRDEEGRKHWLDMLGAFMAPAHNMKAKEA